MNKQEFREAISKSKGVEWLNNELEVVFNYPTIGESFNLSGIVSVYDFLIEQVDGWQSIEIVPDRLKSSEDHFKVLKEAVQSFAERNVESSSAELAIEWSHLSKTLRGGERLFTYDSPQAQFLIEISSNYPDLVIQGAYNYFIKANPSLSSQDLLIGNMLAFEFDFADRLSKGVRRTAEAKSLSHFRGQYRTLIRQSESQMVDHIKGITQKYQDFTSEIDQFKNDKEKEVADWFSNAQKNFNEFSTHANKTVGDLESTYSSKLELEAPARYWRQKSVKYFKEAIQVRNILIGFVAGIGLLLGGILVSSPDWIFDVVLKNDATAIVRWSIVLVVLLSFLAYVIRALTKLMFSSFHLARDSEERHTLTYFYLALIKSDSVKEEDRNLILQSLFSRVDTGLLKDDGGPTMPTHDISGILKGNR